MNFTAAGTRHLLYQLTRARLLLRYKRSYLGLAWSLINPLLMMGVFTLIFSRFPRISGSDTPYPLFFLTGYLPWVLFSAGLTTGKDAFIAHSSLVRQTAFPRWTLPAATVLASFIHFLAAFGLWLVAVAIAPSAGLAWSMLALPFLAALLVLFLFGTVLAFSSLQVFYADIGQLLDVFLVFLFYLTPVFYTYAIFGPKDQWIVTLLSINPMAHFITLFRWATLPGHDAGIGSFLYVVAWTAISLWVGGRIYLGRQSTIAKEL